MSDNCFWLLPFLLEVQDELKDDLTWLTKVDETIGGRRDESKTKEELHSKVMIIRAMLEEDLNRERVREADIDDMYAWVNSIPFPNITRNLKIYLSALYFAVPSIEP